MKIFISQSNFIPWRGFFYALNRSDFFVIYDSVQYSKNSFRNRNTILTSGRPEWLTLPVSYKYSELKKVKEMTIADVAWREKSLRKLYLSYKASPFFHEVYELIDGSFANIKSNFLSDINRSLLEVVCNYYEINTNFLSDDFIDFTLEKSERLLHACKQFNADSYLTTETALNYLDLNLFEAHDVSVEILDFKKCLSPYFQNSSQFFPHVSILDYMFNEGKAGQIFFH